VQSDRHLPTFRRNLLSSFSKQGLLLHPEHGGRRFQRFTLFTVKKEAANLSETLVNLTNYKESPQE
jgi:hypothetical protein